MDLPKVSVVMITYGHQDFIEEAINGVLMQECEFNLELIISNDNSPDNTDVIVKNIIKNHKKSNQIKYFKHEKNLGMMPNFIFALQQAKGKYIALCEGDDYWVNKFKIQKQVDFLDKNQDFIISAHRVDELINNSLQTGDWRYNKKKVNYTLPDYLYRLFFHTSSVVFRNKEIPAEILNEKILHGDIALFSYLLLYGKLNYLENTMSVYRKHEGGISNTPKHKDKLNNYNSKILVLNNLNQYSNKKYNKFIQVNFKIEKQVYLMNLKKNFTFHRMIYWSLKLYYKLLILLFKC
jgi:glycosyltransferase involved in cell wall biosynthesis